MQDKCCLSFSTTSYLSNSISYDLMSKLIYHLEYINRNVLLPPIQCPIPLTSGFFLFIKNYSMPLKSTYNRVTCVLILLLILIQYLDKKKNQYYIFLSTKHFKNKFFFLNCFIRFQCLLDTSYIFFEVLR